MDNSSTTSTDVVVIGAGHSGLAFSHCLSESSVDHVVLERGEVANSWRNERWDSLTLLTPNWQCQLPGLAYTGSDPNGFMAVRELVEFIDHYADVIAVPVKTQTTVTSVSGSAGDYEISTDGGTWKCRSVIIASGACNVPVVPKAAESIPESIRSITPHDYHSANQLDPGGVLVVGASATGLQLAEEIRRSGKEVTIATGEHVRIPRTYRGKDIFWWLDRIGISDERYDVVDDIVRARALPSPQLIGCSNKTMLDLNLMAASGAKLVGRLMGFNGNTAQFSGSLKNVCALADLKMGRLLSTIDEWIEENDASDTETSFDEAPQCFAPTNVEASPPLLINLEDKGIRTILWATGFRPDYSWLNLPILDRKGRIKHDGGVTEAPGVYILGLPFLRRRKSSFIHGIEDDARELSDHLIGYLNKMSVS